MTTKVSFTNYNFTVPPEDGSVDIVVNDASWMAPGMMIHVAGAGNFVVSSIKSCTVTATLQQGLSKNVTGVAIAAGAGVFEGHRPSSEAMGDPATAKANQIYDGGTGAYTAADARSNLGIPTIQTGTATLVAGIVTISSANVTSNSKFFVCRLTHPGVATTGVIGWSVTAISTGTPGSFTITSIDRDGAAVAADVSTLNWMVVG